MNGRFFPVAIALVLGLLSTGLVSADPRRNPPKPNPLDNDIRKQSDAVKSAAGNVNTQASQAGSAKAAWAKAKAHHEQVMDRTKATRKKVEEEHDKDPALVAARKVFDERKAAYETAAAPVLTALKSRTDYQNAVAAREAVAKKKAVIDAGGVGDRATIAKEMLQATSTMRQFETAACKADPKAASANKALEDAQHRVQELCDLRDEAVKKDSRVASAMRELDSAKKEADAAEKKYEHELKEHREAQQKLAQAESHRRQLEQKKQQQNQPNKGKKK